MRCVQAQQHITRQEYIRLRPKVYGIDQFYDVYYRPDIVAARLQAEAQSHRVDQKQADFYPNISLTAMFGWQAIGEVQRQLWERL